MKPEAQQSPLVSVIICVYNAGPYLRPSLLSVLNQTYRNLQVLVVDDGSTDGCIQSISDLAAADGRVCVLRQANQGKPAAMNLALSQARGQFYAVHDADDLSDPRRIEKQLQCMLSNPDVAAVFCGHELILNGRRLAPIAQARDRIQCRRDILNFEMPAHDPTGMYRMSMVREISYDCSLPIVEGFDYVLKVGERYPMLVLGECLYSYRIHNASVTRRDPHKRDAMVFELLRRACLRRGLDPQVCFPELFGPDAAPQPLPDNNLCAHFMQSVCDLRRQRRPGEALLTAAHSIAMRPTDLRYWKPMVYALLPLRLVSFIRDRRQRRRRRPAPVTDSLTVLST